MIRHPEIVAARYSRTAERRNNGPVTTPTRPSPGQSELARIVESTWAESTRRAYRSQWAQVQSWCDRNGVVSLPLGPEDLARHLRFTAQIARADGSPAAATSTLALRVAAANAVHRIAGLPEPGGHPVVVAALASIRRQRKRPPKQAAAFDVEMLRTTLSHFDFRHWPRSVAARRDAALLLLGFAGALRRSELVGLRTGDVSFQTGADSEPHLRVVIRASKTDQFGDGEVIAVPVGQHPLTCVPCAVRAWLVLSSIEGRPQTMAAARNLSAVSNTHHCDQPWPNSQADQPLLRRVYRSGAIGDGVLSGSSVGAVLERRMSAAGMDPERFSAHSLRAGFVTTADAGGALLTAIMRQTRHRKPETVMRYIRHANPMAGNAVKSVGL